MLRYFALIGILCLCISTMRTNGEEAPAPAPALAPAPATEPAPAPTPDPQAKVTAILANVKAGDTATLEVAEDALVNEGQESVPVLRDTLRAQTEALAKLQTEAGTAEAMTQATAVIDVLDSAIIRLSWGWNPRKALDDWVGRLKNTDGDAYRLPIRPRRVTDDSVARLFPNHLFYIVRFPAAATFPFPLRIMNLFVLQRDGTVLLLSESKGMETFFIDNLPVVMPEDEETAKNVAGVWLRLTQEFAGDGSLRFAIPADKLEATYRRSAMSSLDGWRVSGQAAVDQKSGFVGDITVNMTFNAFGKLKSVMEMQTIAPVPPVETPPAPAAPPATEPEKPAVPAVETAPTPATPPAEAVPAK